MEPDSTSFSVMGDREPIPADLFYISLSPSRWRRAVHLLHSIGQRCPTSELEVRDKLEQFGLPPEAWIDFRIISRWVEQDVPIPLAAILHFVLRSQRQDGSWLAEGQPNTGACYRSLELLASLGWSPNEEVVEKGIDYLVSRIKGGGLSSPAPLPGMPLEVGTTARFLCVLQKFQQQSDFSGRLQKPSKAIRDWLLENASTSIVEEDENRKPLCWWHTDKNSQDPNEGIVGATSLALHALLLSEVDDCDRKKLSGAARWLVRMQHEGGGWGEKKGSSPAIDNTFNVIRALSSFLNAASDGESDLVDEIKSALEKAKNYVMGDQHLRTSNISALAMCLRARLLYCEPQLATKGYDPSGIEVKKVLDALSSRRHLWFHPSAHYYNAILVTGLALAEWRERVRQAGEKVYRMCVDSDGIRLLIHFPISIPPLFPGARDSIYEKFLDILAETRLHPVVFFLEQAVTLRELGSMIASILVLFSVFANQDLVEAIAVQGYGWGFLTPLVLIYISWLFWKWKNRRSFGSFLSTLAMAWCLAFGVMAWLDAAWDKAFLGDWHAPEFWRVFLFFALMADAGARAIRELRLERFLSREEDR